MESHILLLLFLYGFCIVVFNGLMKLSDYQEYFHYLLEPELKTDLYDFIIVGSGTAGSLVAHRLSMLPNVRILILEAGSIGNMLLDVPTLGPMMQGTQYDWQYETTEQENACHAMIGKKCKWPMGKVLGGSGRMNNMIHLGGYINEMVPWLNEMYNTSTLQRYLRDLEKFDLPPAKLEHKTKVLSAFLNAGLELGYKINNLNELDQTGFMEVVVDQKNGARWSTMHNLLTYYMRNSVLLTNSFVKKIIFEASLAKGVLYERFGKEHTATASRGVILASGAIGTPKLLMLSGVGPKNHLENIGIDVIQDLPVGQNLLDHVTTGLDLILLDNHIDFGLSTFLNPVNAYDYFINGKGPLTSPGSEAVAILKTCDINPKKGTKKCNLPDLQLMVLPLGITTDHGTHLHKAININEISWKNYFAKVTLNNSITILPIVLHPKSVGTVELQNKNPFVKPKINPNYFSHEDDMEVILKGIELIKDLLKTKAMVKLGAKLNRNVFPGCEDFKFDSRNYWKCYVKHLTLTTFHPAGTCKMGAFEEDSTVVDFDFKVKGLSRLFVVDASIFPALPSGNINTAVALMARIFSDTMSEFYY